MTTHIKKIIDESSYYTIKQFPIGSVVLVSDAVGLSGLWIDNFGDIKALVEAKLENNTERFTETVEQLEQYFTHKRRRFDVTLSIKGTEFQIKVWEALRAINYGKTASYKEIAESVGSEKAYRAVGMANNRNPIAIIIPCHRVIGHSGHLVGYAFGLHIKEKLLAHERCANIE